MSLRLTHQTATVRRLGGLALSVSLHIATLTIAAYGIVALPQVPQESKSEVEVTYVSLAPTADVRREPMLIEPADLFNDFPADSASLPLPDFDLNITKISTRRNLLFPFITADLSFLDALRHETALSQRRLVNPFQGPAIHGPNRSHHFSPAQPLSIARLIARGRAVTGGTSSPKWSMSLSGLIPTTVVRPNWSRGIAIGTSCSPFATTAS